MHHEEIQRFRQMDQLIRLRATGNYHQFSSKIGVSKATFYRLMDVLKFELEAPIQYNFGRETFEYAKEGRIELRFIPKKGDD